MKKVLAITLTLALTFCLLAIPASAASRKFYIPQKIVEYTPNSGTDGSTPETTTYQLSYDSANKTLTVKGGSQSEALRYFLQNESTDSIANRFISYDFAEVGNEGTYDRFLANDLIHYGKIKRIVFNPGSEDYTELSFKTQNNKVTYCKTTFCTGTVSDINIDNYTYNENGNISQIKSRLYHVTDIPGESKEQSGNSNLTAAMKYDSNKRLKQITVKAYDDDNNVYANYNINYSNYLSNGIPKTVRVKAATDSSIFHPETENYNYTFNSQNQLLKLSDSYSTLTNSYDSQNRLTKITNNNGNRFTYSNFMKI